MQPTQALPMKLPMPLAAGSLESYIQSVNRLPLLSAEQERDYGRRWREKTT